MVRRSNSWQLPVTMNGGVSHPEKPFSWSTLLIRISLWSAICGTVIYIILVKSDFASHLERVFSSLDASPSSSSYNFAIPTPPNILYNFSVESNSGPLTGFVQNYSGTQLATFLGVPYAQPPVGRLRFRPTEAIKPWTEPLVAHDFPSPCVQSEYTQRLFPVHILKENITEDCLYLNIWSPLTETGEIATSGTRKSVMVFIHGGLFTIGSTGVDEYDGRALASYGDVIVVSIQYRLGIFGFLDLDHEQVPGNMGLLDQVEALRWIQTNIVHFGGDPNSVTLFGTSAGSISIGFHMFTSQASPLFQRAILQSGSPALLRQVYSRGESVAEKFASSLGCYQPKNESSSVYDDSDTVLACLDRVPSQRIEQTQADFVRDNPVPFMPTIPSEYIESAVTETNDSVRLNQHEILLGFNANEGALMLHLAYPKVYTRTEVPPLRKLSDVHKKVIEMGMDSGLSESAASTMATLLIKGAPIETPIQWARKVADLFSDIMFVCPTYQFADLLIGRNVSTHMYLFNQRSTSAPWGKWMGVTHHDEIVFVFGYPLRYPQLFSEDDRRMSALMIKTWSHFAKTGNIPQREYDGQWKPYNSHDRPHMHLEMGAMKVGNNFHNESCDLYNLLSDYLG